MRDGGAYGQAYFGSPTREIPPDAVDATLRLWDPRAQAAAVGSLVGHTDVVRGIAISADGGCLVSCSSDRSVKLWSIGQRRVQAELR